MAVSDWDEYIRELKDKLQIKILDLMKDECEKVFQKGDYRQEATKTPLNKIVKKILSENDLGRELVKIIYSFLGQLKKYAEETDELYVSKMQHIYDMQRKMDDNRLALLSSMTFNIIIDDLFRIYSELFSDTVAVTLLQLSKEDYEESFAVSEGYQIGTADNKHHELRKEIMKRVFWEDCGIVEEITGSTGNLIPEELDKYLKNNLYFFTWTQSEMKYYVNECKECIVEHLKDAKYQIELAEIRDIYSKFTNKDNTRADLYYEIIERIKAFDNMD